MSKKKKSFLKKDFGECKTKLIERGEKFTENSEEARKNIACLKIEFYFFIKKFKICFIFNLAHVAGFIRDGAVILTHSMSRVVLDVIYC